MARATDADHGHACLACGAVVRCLEGRCVQCGARRYRSRGGSFVTQATLPFFGLTRFRRRMVQGVALEYGSAVS
jgi:hypothetical protein